MDIANEAARSPATKKRAAEEKTAAKRMWRTAPPREVIDQRPNRKRTLLMFTTVLVLGMVLGAVLMRLRYHAKEALFSVNGSVIYEDYFEHRADEQAGPQVARQIEDEELYLQFAQQQGMAPTEAELDAKMDENSKQPDFEEALARDHQTLDDYRRGLAVNLARAKLLSHGVQVSDGEIRRFYEQNIDKQNTNAYYYTPDTLQLQVILTPNKADADRAMQSLAQGNPFDLVARAYSKDDSSDGGGYIPPIERGRTRFHQIPGFEDDVFRLKVGDTFGPKLYSGAWWIVRCLDKASEKTMPFESVQQDCRFGAMLQKGQPLNEKRVASEFEAFKHKSNVLAFHKEFEAAIRLK